jgi:hypothetical protein
MKKVIFSISFALFVFLRLFSQVEGPERIIGNYSGSQKKGVADGEGKSVGKDTYEGNFKKGYPDGKGTYIFGESAELDGVNYQAGDKYEGEFNKGMFEGYGKLIYSDLQKNMLAGYWNKGKYIGKTKTGYEVLVKKNIARIECRYDGSAKNEITITGLDDIVEAGKANLEFDGKSRYSDIPLTKFPFMLHIKGTVASTGAKAELSVMLERPGTWTIIVTSDAI